MEVFEIPATIIVFLLIILRPLTVFFHEMGHAVTGWLITRKKINVFIGSYGNKDKSFKINGKNFNYYIFKNPLKWGIGLCETEEKKISFNHQILFVFGGPAASLLLAALSYLIISNTDFWEIFFTVLLISSAIDFITNMYPTSKTVYLSDGRSISNDGRTIINLFTLKKLPKEYVEGIDKFKEKKYIEAASIFDEVLKESKDPNVYRMAIVSHLQSRNNKKAKEIAIEFKKNHTMNSDDLINFALTLTYTGELKKSLEYYDKVLESNPKNKFALNNKGYTLILLEEYENSIPLFNKAISLDKNFSYSYNNRGLAKLSLDYDEEGLKDIEDSLKLDPENSDAHKNLGIYHMKKMDYEKALDLFLYARQLDESTYQINELIGKAQSMII
ncbi:hypothetical protein F3J23_14190 [Chryseobacterium sp. Tr-659]|uniref:M50 family metallopeptidase n=1 Tax=Chryseobacterium sp. Tr-659 TaxID=2608340 RepID=UPI0014206A96|nr:M50 family metallopeptidase [Chryseobacterium sp. Tr-659]NIF06595.1 hypothetical protein [Chryseobacterium sp. Tr-659]